MSITDRYFDLREALQAIEDRLREMRHQLRDMAREIERGDRTGAKAAELAIPSYEDVVEAIKRRHELDEAMREAWESIPENRRAHMTAPLARRAPIPQR